jgi:hypothetical protein
MTVMVGDTVTWQGSFSSHPLSTTSVPPGAATINSINSGSTYSYVVLVPGSYGYRCDLHYAMGMVGSFTASPISAVEEITKSSPLAFKLSTLGGLIKITDKSDAKGDYEVSIRNILGEPVWNGTMKSDEDEKIIDIDEQPKGVYLLVVADQNRQSFIKKFLIQ